MLATQGYETAMVSYMPFEDETSEPVLTSITKPSLFDSKSIIFDIKEGNLSRFRDHFRSVPKVRKMSIERFSRYIASKDDIATVLLLGTASGIPNAYHTALDLLEKAPSDLLLDVLRALSLSDYTNIPLAERWLDLLLDAVSRNKSIEPFMLAEQVIRVLQKPSGRLIQLAVINSLFTISERVIECQERTEKIAKAILLCEKTLQWFASGSQKDHVVRSTALEALEALEEIHDSIEN